MAQIYRVRGIRGAITCEDNNPGAINEATKELLVTIAAKNDLVLEDIVSIFFTVTSDLNADFPASAARDLGWSEVPLLCATEISVPNSISNCIRVLVHVNTPRMQSDIIHCYLRDASKLRPDLAK